MKNIALIPARGNSKSIKNKNISLLKGRPLISYSIEVALEADFFDRIIVTTDCENIAKIAL